MQRIRYFDSFSYRYKDAIYAIKCLGSNTSYIGSTIDLDRRISAHLGDISSNKHSCTQLTMQYRAYGPDAFVVCVISPGYGMVREDLYQFEKLAIRACNGNLFNNTKYVSSIISIAEHPLYQAVSANITRGLQHLSDL